METKMKKIAQILALTASLFLVACGGGSTTEVPVPISYEGTYKGTVTGLNAGPVTFIVAANNKVTGDFNIINRQVACASRGGVCKTKVDGMVISNGTIKGDFVDTGARTMHFEGKIVGNEILNGTWGEYKHDPIPDGKFTAMKQI